MMRITGAILGALLLLAPLGAKAADLVVWWEKGYYDQEGEALREIIAAFEQESGKQVELVSSPRRSFRTRSWQRSSLESRPTSPSASCCRTTSPVGL